MRADVEAALTRALDWLGGLDNPPGLQAREARDGAGVSVSCAAVPYAIALAAGMARRGARLRAPDVARLGAWLRGATDPDGQVRFFGPDHHLIGPDHDDLALIWLERRALLGEHPPAALLTRLLQRRLDSGALDTWPSPPEDGPPREADAAVNANVLAWLATLGRRDPPAERWLVAQLQRDPAAALVAPYYPDPAVVWLLAWRAWELGGLETLPPRPAGPADGLMALALKASEGEPGAVESLLRAQQPDGSWPWAPVFVGGPRTGLPTGEVLDRPWFGGEALSTALVFDALARALGLPMPPLAPDRGEARVAAPRAELAWEALVGPLGDGLRLEAGERASMVVPLLRGPLGTMDLDIAWGSEGPSFCRAGPWSVSYRGQRAPDGAEAGAMRTLAERLQATAPAGEASPQAVETVPETPTLRVQRADATDLPALLQGLARNSHQPSATTWDPPALTPRAPSGALRRTDSAPLSASSPRTTPAQAPPGVSLEVGEKCRLGTATSEVRIELPASLALPRALPAIDAALRGCRARGLRPSLVGLPVCALPMDEAWIADAPATSARPLAAACGRCVVASRCAGPAGGTLRPRTAEQPWQPLRRAGAAWAERTGALPVATLESWARTLGEVARDPELSGADWSLTLALDALGGELSPVFRLAAFHGRRAGVIPSGAAVLAALPTLARVPGGLTDALAMQAALADLDADAPTPLYPGLEHGPDGARVSLYLDTDHLAPDAAWRLASALAARLGLDAPPLTCPLLGLSLHIATSGETHLDLYARWRGAGTAPFTPPEPVLHLAPVEDLVLTLRCAPHDAPQPRKWDLPWWPRGEDDEALGCALGLSAGGRKTLHALLDDPGFTLHPTTFGWRPGGRRIYARLL